MTINEWKLDLTKAYNFMATQTVTIKVTQAAHTQRMKMNQDTNKNKT